MYKVSVVIPVYNAQKYLRECLESVKNQSLKDIQVILVDDGSTDDSIRILEEYVQNDSRFLLIRQKNQYAGVARNNGLRVAKGEYICFFDADDYFEKTMLEEMYQTAITHNSDITICDVYLFDNISKTIQIPSWMLRDEYIPENMQTFSYQDMPERIFQLTTAAPWNKLYKKSFLDDLGLQFQGTKIHNDEYFVSMSMVLAKKISVVNNRLVYYRINNNESLQGMDSLETVSYAFYKALTAIQTELISKGIYKAVERSFINKCITICIGTLNKQKNYDNFSEIYNFIKKNVFNKLNIKNFDDTFFYSNSNYDIIKRIFKYTPEEFIFYENILYKQNLKDCYYIFPFDRINGARNIAVYGAGKVGKEYVRQIQNSNTCNLAGWFDIKYEKYQKDGLPVSDIKNIINTTFDKIVIAIEDCEVIKSVKRYLIEQGLSESQIIC